MPLLPLLAANGMIAMLAAAMGALTGAATPQFLAHLAFAFGILPLILAAMGYFIPVLTRQSPSPRLSTAAPLLAWAGAGLALAAFASDFSFALLLPAATLAATAALALIVWAIALSRRSLGPRHRGLDWYFAALGFLILALLAIWLMPFLPDYRQALRVFHLHANLLGFIGLTAIGTLQVLLPTCLGKPDPNAIKRLRSDLPWAASGVALVVVAAFVASLPGPFGDASPAPSLGVLGAGLLLAVVGRMLWQWHRLFGASLRQRDGAASSLACAALAFVILLLAGILHAYGLVAGRTILVALVIAFLLPLVSGAVAQLLPVWLRPGMQTPWHASLRQRLGRYAGLRAWGLLLLGLMLIFWIRG